MEVGVQGGVVLSQVFGYVCDVLPVMPPSIYECDPVCRNHGECTKGSSDVCNKGNQCQCQQVRMQPATCGLPIHSMQHAASK